MATPWICDRCGEVANGDMCVKCGNSHGHGPIVKDDRIQAYQTGPLVGSSGRLSGWGPITWIALIFFVAFVALCLVAGFHS